MPATEIGLSFQITGLKYAPYGTGRRWHFSKADQILTKLLFGQAKRFAI